MTFKWDPQCLAVDALQQLWRPHRLYALPFSLIRRTIKKIILETITLILITPAWQSQPWYPMLLYINHSQSNSTSLETNNSTKPSRRFSSTNRVQIPSTSGLVDLRNKLETEG